MMEKIRILKSMKTMLKFAMILSMLLTLWMGTNILSQYYTKYGDLKFTEYYDLQRNFETGQYEIPLEVQQQVHRMNQFRLMALITIVFYILLEIVKYKLNPEEHFFKVLKKGFKGMKHEDDT